MIGGQVMRGGGLGRPLTEVEERWRILERLRTFDTIHIARPHGVDAAVALRDEGQVRIEPFGRCIAVSLADLGRVDWPGDAA